jgi:hypothetical protein
MIPSQKNGNRPPPPPNNCNSVPKNYLYENMPPKSCIPNQMENTPQSSEDDKSPDYTTIFI